MKIGKILDISLSFIFKNILWITLLGVLISLQNFFLPELSAEVDPDNIYSPLMYKLAAGGVSFLLLPILAGTVTLALADHYFERKSPWYQAFFKCLKRFIPLVLLQLLAGLIVGLGGICFVIPGFIALCGLAVSIPALMIEDLKVTDAISRSFMLTKGHRWRILGYFFLCQITVIIFSLLLTFGGMKINIPLTNVVMINTVILAPLNALFPAICTLLYFDIRFRKEAMDIEEEANAIDVAAAELA